MSKLAATETDAQADPRRSCGAAILELITNLHSPINDAKPECQVRSIRR